MPFVFPFTVAIDATRRGRQGDVRGITTFLLGPIGLVLYVLAVLGAMAGSESDRAEEDDGNCRARVGLDSERCRNCGPVL